MTADAKDCDGKAFSVLRCNAVRVGVFLVVSALLVRGAVCWRSLEQYSADPDAYRAIAETLGVTGIFGLTADSGEVIATAFRPPLYPTVLSWLLVNQNLSNAAVAYLHTLLGVVAVLFTYLAALSMLPRNTSFWGPAGAAILVMVDPLLLQQSTVLMTETLATTIVCLIFWWWSACRHRVHDVLFAVVLGGLLSLAFLARPTFLAWAVLLVFAWFVFEMVAFGSVSKRSWKQRLVPAAVPCGVVMVALTIVVAGWMLRNVRAVGHPVWATTHGGYTLLLGNNPSFYQYLRTGWNREKWDSEPFQIAYSHRYDGDPRTEGFWQRNWEGRRRVQDQSVIAVVTEHSDDLLAYESAKAVIRRQPRMFLWSAGVRVCRLWNPFPGAVGGRQSWLLRLVGIYGCCLYVAMLLGAGRLGRRLFTAKWLPVLTLLVTLTAVHAVYWSNIRMRAPAVPAIALLAAAAIPPLRGRSESAEDAERDTVCG